MKTIDQTKPTSDPVITEVRHQKMLIAEAYDFDVVALGRALQAREAGDARFKAPNSKVMKDQAQVTG